MKLKRFRATTAALFGASLLVAALVAAPTASAAITGSTITTPTDPTFLNTSINSSNNTATGTFAIAGTTSGGTPGTDQVDILCYYGAGSHTTVASAVPTNPNGSFSVPSASMTPLWQGNGICRLRAVPAGTTPVDPTPFSGPRVTITGNEPFSDVGGQYDYYLYGQQLTAAVDYDSLSSCGLDDGYLFDPTLTDTTTTFYCNAALFDGNSNSSPTRSEIQVDGVDTYSAWAAEVHINSAAPGFPALTETYTFDAATGNVVIHETAPLVQCRPDTSYPPDSTKCASFASAGVTDNRTITQDHDGHLSWITDLFTSTDGRAHTLDLLWENDERFQGGSGDSTQNEYEFPGQSSFSLHALNDAVTLPASSPGTILVRVHNAADGTMTTGQGAVVYDRPATGATFTFVNTSYEAFTLHQTGTVPAGGSTRFRFAYAQDYLAANVASLAQTASTAFLNVLSVSKEGAGSGTVTSAPGGISCGSTCSAGYGYGTSVTLTATPSTGSIFTGWLGACSGTGTCTVTTNDATSVTATFSVIPETLSVTKRGDGKGRVTSYPTGVSCTKGTCRRTYDYGTTIILRAKAAKGSSFNGWSGACKGKQPCALLMQSAKAVKATFLKMCLVPRLKGKSLKTAKRLLRSHDCGLGKIRHAFSRTVRRGSVISTKPRAGRRLKHGGKVTLVLNG